MHLRTCKVCAREEFRQISVTQHEDDTREAGGTGSGESFRSGSGNNDARVRRAKRAFQRPAGEDDAANARPRGPLTTTLHSTEN